MTPIAGLGSPPRANQVPREPSSESSLHARAYLARYEIDRRSIFIGNLPSGTVESQIHDIFEYYGLIVGITVRDTLSKFDGESASYPPS
jgi:RNA recognition motif-containing protein